MKKIAVLTLSLLSASVAQAQDAGGFRLGIKVGATYSNISGNNVSQITGPNYSSDLGDYKLGYNAGLTFGVPFNTGNTFFIAPELLYNRKGYEIQSTQTSGLAAGVSKVEYEQQRVLHYLDVPILARFKVKGLILEIGPQVSYLFGSKTKQQTTTKYTNGDKDKVESSGGFLDYTGISRGPSDKSDLAQFDISGVAGVGFESDAGLTLALRYARGFNSLIDSKDTKNDPKAFNNAFTLQLGYLLPFGR